MKNGLARTPSGGYANWKNGKIIFYQPPFNASDPWRPANANVNANGTTGYKKVSHGSKYYWQVKKNANGKWKTTSTKYYEKKNSNKFMPITELKI